MYRVAQKTAHFYLRSHNFATTDDRKECNMSKVPEFCLDGIVVFNVPLDTL